MSRTCQRTFNNIGEMPKMQGDIEKTPQDSRFSFSINKEMSKKTTRMSNSIVETLKDTKQHWGNIGGHQVVSRKCQGTSEKRFLFCFFSQATRDIKKTSRGHQQCQTNVRETLSNTRLYVAKEDVCNYYLHTKQNNFVNNRCNNIKHYTCILKHMVTCVLSARFSNL